MKCPVCQSENAIQHSTYTTGGIEIKKTCMDCGAVSLVSIPHSLNTTTILS